MAACNDDDSTGDHHGETEESGTPSGATCPPDGAPSYDSFGKGFMDQYCVRCHSSKLKDGARMGAPPGHDFDLEAGIAPVAEHIDEFAAAGPDAVNVKMPPTDPKPTEAERTQLGKWLACVIAAEEKGKP